MGAFLGVHVLTLVLWMLGNSAGVAVWKVGHKCLYFKN